MEKLTLADFKVKMGTINTQQIENLIGGIIGTSHSLMTIDCIG